MNSKNIARVSLASAILLLLCGCNKSSAPTTPEVLYQAHHGAAAEPVNFLHSKFTVGTSARFGFEVPAHSVSPKLQGTFKAYKAGDPDAPALVDVLVLTPEQFQDFSRGNGEPTYSVMGSSGQTVDYALPPTIDEAQKYYLVFRPTTKGTRGVEADFTASFE